MDVLWEQFYRFAICRTKYVQLQQNRKKIALFPVFNLFGNTASIPNKTGACQKTFTRTDISSL